MARDHALGLTRRLSLCILGFVVCVMFAPFSSRPVIKIKILPRGPDIIVLHLYPEHLVPDVALGLTYVMFSMNIKAKNGFYVRYRPIMKDLWK